MSEFITLSCPSCGGKLNITSEVDRFTCGYCGRAQIVQRSGGTVKTALVIDAIRRVESGVDRTASELALSRLNRQLQDVEARKRLLVENYPESYSGKSPVFFIVFGALLGIGAPFTLGDNGPELALSAVLLIGLGIVWYRHESAAAHKRIAEFENGLLLINAELKELNMEKSRHLAIIGRE